MKQLSIAHKKPDCIGCALCVEVAPDYFQMDENGEAELIQVVREKERFQFGEGFAQDREGLEAAEEGCPVNIIRINARCR